jgi:uncharacterized protein (TIGR03000 family)
VTPVGAAIRAYGPARYYYFPRSPETPRGTPSIYSSPVYPTAPDPDSRPHDGRSSATGNRAHRLAENRSLSAPSTGPRSVERKEQSQSDEVRSVAQEKTSLTLHVPEDATVQLAGMPTTTTGPVRTYATTRLSSGQQILGYSVRVSVERHGRTWEKQQTIPLRAGQDVTLVFRFDADQLADVR